MTEKEWLNNNDLSLAIYNKKYRNGNESFDDFLNRISCKNETIKNLIKDKKFIFGGRILANRGVTNRVSTYSNCFSGDTKIMTSNGLFELQQLVGQNIKVLSKNSWRDATVQSFGKQHLKQLVLQRGKSTRSIYVTDNHLWFVQATKSKRILKQTNQLRIGDTIPTIRNDNWHVSAIIDTDRFEEVYCAVVPDTESFTLEGGILTHNCYVLEPPRDNIESIFDCAGKMARTFSYGGKLTTLPPYIVIYRKQFSEPIHIGCVLLIC